MQLKNVKSFDGGGLLGQSYRIISNIYLKIALRLQKIHIYII